MDKKTFQCKLKFDEEKRIFTGYLATYGNVDKGGDAIQPGAFSKSLQSNPDGLPLLFAHDQSRPIGKAELTDSQKGLKLKGRLIEGVRAADEAYALLKAGIIRGLSIGYDTVKAQMIGEVRRLLEIKLYEASLVVLPMNEEAIVTAVKKDDGLEAELKSAVELFVMACDKKVCSPPERDWFGY